MFNLYSGLPKNREERIAHIKKLTEVYECKKHSVLFDFLYGNLNILDSKASALLSFNSIMAAISSIYVVNQTGTLERIPFILAILFLFISCILCMKIIWLHWSSSEDLVSMKEHAIVLLTVRFQRTVIYRMAWWFSMFAILLSAVAIPIVEFIE